MKECYHKSCDTYDLEARGKESPVFLAAVTQAVLDSVMELAEEEKTVAVVIPETSEATTTTITTTTTTPTMTATTVSSSTSSTTITHRNNQMPKNQILYYSSPTVDEPNDGSLSSISQDILPLILYQNQMESGKAILKELTNIQKSLSDQTRPVSRDNHYGHVDTQINVENLHLAMDMSSLLQPESQNAIKEPEFVMLSPEPLQPRNLNLGPIQRVIQSYYSTLEKAKKASPMVVKFKSDL